MAVGASSPRTASSSNSVTASISVPIEMLVTRSKITSTTTGTRNSAMGGALDVPGEDVPNSAVAAHRRVEGIDRRAGQSEGLGRTFQLEDLHRGVGGGHLCHLMPPSSWHGPKVFPRP